MRAQAKDRSNGEPPHAETRRLLSAIGDVLDSLRALSNATVVTDDLTAVQARTPFVRYPWFLASEATFQLALVVHCKFSRHHIELSFIHC